MYNEILKEKRLQLKLTDVPAMPVMRKETIQAAAHRSPRQRGAEDHNDNVQTAGFVSGHYFALVHQPIDIDKAKLIPDAKKALDKECAKLESKPVQAWDVSTVMGKERRP